MKRDRWTFLTNHGHVLVCLALEPDALLRDVATSIGITERCAQQIVADLERAGVVIRMRVGRRNRYVVRREECFRHGLEAGVTVGQFVDLVESGRARVRHLPRAHVPVTSPTSLSAVRATRDGDAVASWQPSQWDERPSSR